jgi:hypothetical protein
MKMKKTLFIMIGITIGLLAASQTEASVITMETSATVEVKDNLATVRVSATNKGDEPAHNVRINAQVGETVVNSLIQDMLKPTNRYEQEWGVELKFEKAGRYPVIVTVEYTDANQYPFTALTVVFLDYKEKAIGRIVSQVETLELVTRGKGEGKGSLKVAVKNLEAKEHKVHLRLLLPKDFAPVPAKTEVISVGSEKIVVFDVQNLSGLPGSQYQAYVLMEYENEQYHYTHLQGSRVVISSEKGIPDSARIGLVAAAVALVGIAIYANRNRRKG